MRSFIALLFVMTLAAFTAQPAGADQQTKELQGRLAKLGYDVSVDGHMGGGTEKALRKFQQDRGISPADGRLNKETREALFADTPSSDKVAANDGTQCSGSVTATGYRRITESRAKESAERAWSNKVATLNGYGLSYADLKLARDSKTVCIKACAECTISKVCTLTAEPCKPKNS
jgi:peptidoglycan hydrolase-like protein with peptidoglycan-binding domain